MDISQRKKALLWNKQGVRRYNIVQRNVVERRHKERTYVMLKRLIGRLFRWFRRVFCYLCQLDLDKDACGLADCFRLPLTEEDKAEQIKKQLLFGVKEEDRENMLEHFEKLKMEQDPLGGQCEEIQPDSVKTICCEEK